MAYAGIRGLPTFLERAWNEVGGSLPGETIQSGKHLLDSFFHVLEDWYDLIVDVSVSFLRGDQRTDLEFDRFQS
jgi:hypothetical protein